MKTLIRLMRIDDRLIHGQVAFVWVSTLKSNLIVVANDKYANNKMLQTTLKLGKPSGIDMIVRTLEDTIKFLKTEVAQKKNIFLVVESTQDALKLVSKIEENQLNLPFDICIGGVRPSNESESKLVATQVYLTKEDIKNLDAMKKIGRSIFAQGVPSNKKVSFDNIKKKY